MGIITTKEFYDDLYQEEFLKEQNYILAERHEQEMLIWQEVIESEQKAIVLVGKPRKKRKFETHGIITTTKKVPRFIQYYHRRLSSSTEARIITRPDILSGMPF